MDLQSLETIARALNDAGVRYLVVGGVAVNAHGFTRVTNDLDLVLAVDEANLLNGLHTLQSIGFQTRVPITPAQFASPANRAAWQADKGMVVLQLWCDAHQAMPVDIFLAEPFPFAEEWQHAPRIELAPDLLLPVVSKTTLLAMKKSAGRPKDLEDIRRLNSL